MGLIVQKFGGTSLGTAERMLNVARIITETAKTNNVIAVVSAMSSYTKAEGTTSRLLQAGDLAIAGGTYFKVIDLIEENHVLALNGAIKNIALREEIKEAVHNELLTLKSFLQAIQVIREISSRSQDVIVGTGERLSALLLSGILQDQGHESVYVNLSECVSEGLKPTDRNFYPELQQRIVQKLPKSDTVIPVVTGFFGFVPGGIIASIGRGYTDLTAALVAAETKAEEMQVWKEVDGIFTADPRKVPNARVLETITPEEAAELTYFGSEVLHPFTMERAISANVPIRIKNTFDDKKPGTVVQPRSVGKTAPKSVAAAVTAKRHISILNINSNRMLHSTGFIAEVFDVFRRHAIVIDLISTSEVNISCTIDKTEGFQAALDELSKMGQVTLGGERAILSLVGGGMKHMPGVAGKMFTALAEDGINIEMITQGASEINISCVIQQSQADRAIQVLHRTFLEN